MSQTMTDQKAYMLLAWQHQAIQLVVGFLTWWIETYPVWKDRRGTPPNNGWLLYDRTEALLYETYQYVCGQTPPSSGPPSGWTPSLPPRRIYGVLKRVAWANHLNTNSKPEDVVERVHRDVELRRKLVIFASSVKCFSTPKADAALDLAGGSSTKSSSSTDSSSTDGSSTNGSRTDGSSSTGSRNGNGNNETQQRQQRPKLRRVTEAIARDLRQIDTTKILQAYTAFGNNLPFLQPSQKGARWIRKTLVFPRIRGLLQRGEAGPRTSYWQRKFWCLARQAGKDEAKLEQVIEAATLVQLSIERRRKAVVPVQSFMRTIFERLHRVFALGGCDRFKGEVDAIKDQEFESKGEEKLIRKRLNCIWNIERRDRGRVRGPKTYQTLPMKLSHAYWRTPRRLVAIAAANRLVAAAGAAPAPDSVAGASSGVGEKEKGNNTNKKVQFSLPGPTTPEEKKPQLLPLSPPTPVPRSVTISPRMSSSELTSRNLKKMDPTEDDVDVYGDSDIESCVDLESNPDIDSDSDVEIDLDLDVDSESNSDVESSHDREAINDNSDVEDNDREEVQEEDYEADSHEPTQPQEEEDDRVQVRKDEGREGDGDNVVVETIKDEQQTSETSKDDGNKGDGNDNKPSQDKEENIRRSVASLGRKRDRCSLDGAADGDDDLQQPSPFKKRRLDQEEKEESRGASRQARKRDRASMDGAGDGDDHTRPSPKRRKLLKEDADNGAASTLVRKRNRASLDGAADGDNDDHLLQPSPPKKRRLEDPESRVTSSQVRKRDRISLNGAADDNDSQHLLQPSPKKRRLEEEKKEEEEDTGAASQRKRNRSLDGPDDGGDLQQLSPKKRRLEQREESIGAASLVRKRSRASFDGAADSDEQHQRSPKRRRRLVVDEATEKDGRLPPFSEAKKNEDVQVDDGEDEGRSKAEDDNTTVDITADVPEDESPTDGPRTMTAGLGTDEEAPNQLKTASSEEDKAPPSSRPTLPNTRQGKDEEEKNEAEKEEVKSTQTSSSSYEVEEQGNDGEEDGLAGPSNGRSPSKRRRIPPGEGGDDDCDRRRGPRRLKLW